jgi:hypothetical protein
MTGTGVRELFNSIGRDLKIKLIYRTQSSGLHGEKHSYWFPIIGGEKYSTDRYGVCH